MNAVAANELDQRRMTQRGVGPRAPCKSGIANDLARADNCDVLRVDGIDQRDVAGGPLPWWKAALGWPWSVAIRFSGTMHPVAIMLMLFAVYSTVAFLILQYLIVKPALKPRTT